VASAEAEEEGQALMAKKLAKRFKSQVNAESQLRFGPERRALRGQKREAKRTYRSDVGAAKATARGSASAARAADPQLKRVFGSASEAVNAGPSPDVATSALGPAAGRDADGTKRRLAETMAMAQQELIAREQDAYAGRDLAISSARGRRDEAVDRANEGLRGVARDSGAFRQGRTGELIEGARDRQVTRDGQRVTANNNRRTQRQSERNSLRSSGRDPDTNEITPGGKLDPDGNGKPGDQSKGKPGGASPSRVEGATSAITLGRTQAKRLKGSGRSKQEALDLLTTGRPSQTVEDEKGNKVKVPGVSKVKAVFAKASVELEFDGQVSDRTRQRLNALGYSMKQLGLKRNRTEQRIRGGKVKGPPAPDNLTT
jgi:hypothetical protein